MPLRSAGRLVVLSHPGVRDLDRALATLRKQDRQFRQRIKKAAMYLTAPDAEAIILLATHGIVRLELLEQPIHLTSKPSYL